LSGSLLVDDFEVNLPASGKIPEVRTQWDSFSSALQLSFNAINLQGANLRHGSTSAEFDASASLQHGHLTSESFLNLNANLQGVDLAFLQAVAGYNYPISGKADVLVKSNSKLSDLQAAGQTHITNATVYGEPIQQMDSNFRVAHGEIALSDLHLVHDASITTGSASYNPANRTFTLDLAGNNFDLAGISQLQWSRLPLDGHADFILQASGTAVAPIINADIHAHALTFDGELFGEVDLHAVTESGNLRLTADTNLAKGSVVASGNIRLSNDHSADISFRIDQIDPDALWRGYFGNQLTGHSAATGTATLRGPLFQPGKWVFAGDLSHLSIDVENVKLHNQDPVRFVIGDQALRVSQLHMLGEGTDLTTHGSVLFSGDLDFTADGRLDLKLLNAFDSNLTASGLATVNMTLGGTFDDPLPQGRIQFTNGSMVYASLPSGLNELNGSLVFTRDHVSIEALNARTGGGGITLKGDATYSNRQLNFNLTASGKDVRLRYPPGVSSTADAELHWVGSRSASSITGDITINKIAVTPGFDFSSYLERSRQGSTLTVANSPLYNVKLDVHVQTAPELQMRTAIARLSGDADLRLRGSAARPALLGRVDILEGQATFHGTRFTLERGDITFANPVSIEPQLNLQASTHVRNYDLSITVSGTTERGLNLNYRSEPPLPKSDIIALLALGRTGDESAQLQEQSGQSAFTDQATALILDQALNSTVSSRFQRLFGASNIKIDPQGLTTETNPTGRGPQVTIEQEFANNLSLTYSTNVAQSSQQIIEGEYYFNRNLSVVGTRDQNGVVSFDIRVRRRKK
jgi:translocation and assembly module TamB